jgi:opacity protein-like surface antigen
MKKLIISGAILLLLSLPIYSNIKFSFKLSGGAASLFGGDLNGTIKENHKRFADYNNIGISASLDHDELKWMPEFNGELIFHFTPKFAIGIGVGYLSKTTKGESLIDYYYSYWNYYEEAMSLDASANHSYMLRAVPITLNLYYFAQLSKSISVFFSGGIGYYLGEAEYEESYDASLVESWWDMFYFESRDELTANGTISEKVSATAVGFQGGIGFQFNFSRNFGVLTEITGRFVNFKNWEGDYSHNWSWEEVLWDEETDFSIFDSGAEQEVESGKLWYFTYEDDLTNNSYKRIGVRTDKPETSIREAEINLNGFSLRIGIVIRF